MITANDIVKANEVLKNVVERTPLDFDRYLSAKYGATIYIKKENMQKVRSFKLRGAYYAIHQLSDEDKEHGVVCASAGNHAQGVAYTCNEMKIPATIFMPVTTPLQKIGQVRFFGGKFVTIKLVGDTFDESAKAAQEYTKSEGMTFIDPFDDYNVQAGQGTVAYEIYEQAQEEGVSFDSILVPVGGGGLISGVATYIKDVAPSIEVVQKVGAKTYEVARKYVDRLLGVDEGLISETLIDMYSKVGTIAEPAGAASVAALEVIKDEIKGKTIVCIISGGNNDINRMPEMEERALIYDGIKHYFVVNFPQRPGALREFVNDILGPNDDITRFEYIKRANKGKGPVLIGIALSDKNDYDGLLERLSEFDPSYINLNGNETLYNMLV